MKEFLRYAILIAEDFKLSYYLEIGDTIVLHNERCHRLEIHYDESPRVLVYLLNEDSMVHCDELNLTNPESINIIKALASRISDRPDETWDQYKIPNFQ